MGDLEACGLPNIATEVGSICVVRVIAENGTTCMEMVALLEQCWNEQNRSELNECRECNSNEKIARSRRTVL